MTRELKDWDVADYLTSEARISAYLKEVFDDGDPALIASAIGAVARAKSMTKIAKDTKLGRESLYKTLSAEGNPSFSTIIKVLDSLGLKLTVSSSAISSN